MIYTKFHAVDSLKPKKSWTWEGTDFSGFTYEGEDTAPTESEINAEVTRLNDAEFL